MNHFQKFQSHEKIHQDGHASRTGETKKSGKLNALYSSGLEKADE